MYIIQSTIYPKPKSAYETRFASTNEAQIALLWRALNIGRGYKGRLLKDGKVIARKTS